MPKPFTHFHPVDTRFRFLPALGGGLEVVLVIGLSTLAVIFAQTAFTPTLGEALGMAGGEIDLLTGSWVMLRMFAMQYGTLLALAVIFAFLRGRRSARSYALGRGRLTPIGIIKWGVALGLVAGGPATLILFLQDVAPFGEDTPVWAALRQVPKDGEFWLFLFVGSFGIVPLVEELTWRSYAIGRLTEVFAPGAAILFTAVPFALLHVQYASLDPAMIATSASVILVSLAFAFATVRTGSVWPAVIGHAITNFPAEGWLGATQLVAGLILLVIFIRPICHEVTQWGVIFFRWSTFQAFLILIPITTIIALTLALQTFVLWIAGAMVVMTLGLAIAFRSNWRQSST